MEISSTPKENDQNEIEILIKSGNKNKSINYYVKRISKKILEKYLIIQLNAYGIDYLLKRIIISTN